MEAKLIIVTLLIIAWVVMERLNSRAQFKKAQRRKERQDAFKEIG